VREIVESVGVCSPWRPAWLSFRDPASSIYRHRIDKRLPVTDKLFNIFSIRRMGKASGNSERYQPGKKYV
jgi:hypothetical protein